MLDKPATCLGCPFAGDMKGFVPDEIGLGTTTIMVLGQNPGAEEEASGRPFCGATGQLQDTRFLPLAQLERGKNVHVANLLKCRWTAGGHKTNDLPKGKILQEAVAHCTQAHLDIPIGTKTVIVQGKHAASWVRQQNTSVDQWRGRVLHPVPDKYVRQHHCVEHLANILHPKSFRVAQLD